MATKAVWGSYKKTKMDRRKPRARRVKSKTSSARTRAGRAA